MPLFSVVVPSFNNAPYVGGCLDSILNQSFRDIEVIVVNDASTDNTKDIVESYAKRDSRIVLLNKEQNEGLHLARKSGVELASGEWLLFVDSDDELAPSSLEQLSNHLQDTDSDIVHFGIKCIAANGFSDDDAEAFESWANGDFDFLNRDALLTSVFTKEGKFAKDWNMDHRLFRLSLIKRAFAQMSCDRLERAEDAYEFLVTASLGNGELTVDDSPFYLYYIGRGVTNNKLLNYRDYSEYVSKMEKVINVVRAYSCSGDAVLETAGADLSSKLSETVFNAWIDRVSADQKDKALEAVEKLIPEAQLASGLMRYARDNAYECLQSDEEVLSDSPCIKYYVLSENMMTSAKDINDVKFESYRSSVLNHFKAILTAHFAAPDFDRLAELLSEAAGEDIILRYMLEKTRDEAYELVQQDIAIEGNEECFKWFKKAEAAIDSRPSLSDCVNDIYSEAVEHLSELEHRSAWSSDNAPTLSRRRDYDAQAIRIFVTTHKDVETYHSNILQPVQVSAKSNRERLLWAFQDDSGENIADKNASYCELTTQYWAWKNIEAEYYGFCHYRRYFDFSASTHTENQYGEVIDKFIDWDSQKRYALSDKEIIDAVHGWDIVTTGIKDLHDFPEAFANPVEQYSRAPYLKVTDLERVVLILKDKYPDYAIDADNYLSGHFACFCNMYVMRKDYFFKYCEWMFPILEEFCSGWETSSLSHEALRTPGHLSERLFNIWLLHEKRVNPSLKHKEVQCVHFEYPEHVIEPTVHAVRSVKKQIIPVVFAADNNYVPMVTTTICSLLENASRDCYYDIVVLEKDFSTSNKNVMTEFVARYGFASIRFVNVAGMIKAYDLQTNNEHISVETYYRFLIQKVLPDYEKVIYLDSDLIIKGDISKLFAIDLGNNLLGAARDIDYLGNLNMNDGVRMKYTNEVLGLKNPYGYFQAGVLLLNTAEMRKLYPFQHWLEIASEPKYIYDDQDILNAHCQGRVTYLNNAWNVMNDCGGRIQKVFTFAPAIVFDEFMAAYSDPKILHYAGFEKPWKPGNCDQAELYWSYARQTPFYETLLDLKFATKTELSDGLSANHLDIIRELKTPPRAISEDSPLRNSFDKILPLGSRRREVAKSLVRKVRGRQ